jgi:hypothetical protein
MPLLLGYGVILPCPCHDRTCLAAVLPLLRRVGAPSRGSELTVSVVEGFFCARGSLGEYPSGQRSAKKAQTNLLSSQPQLKTKCSLI